MTPRRRAGRVPARLSVLMLAAAAVLALGACESGRIDTKTTTGGYIAIGGGVGF